MTLDVTDANFEAEVLDRSKQVPVVVDLWATWCGPCKTLGPILEKVIDATDGKVALVKIDVDDNPRASATFQVQSIPAVYAIRDRKVVDGFVGAQGEAFVKEWVDKLLPSEQEQQIGKLMETGDEASWRQVLELDPGHAGAIVALAEHLVGKGQADDALALLERIPESNETRRVAALARVGGDSTDDGDVEGKLDALLDRVKEDPGAKQEFLDLLELMGPDDPRTAGYRKALTARLY